MNWFLIVAMLFVATGTYLVVFQFPKWQSVTVTEPVVVQRDRGEIQEPDWRYVRMACVIGLCGLIAEKWPLLGELWAILIAVVMTGVLIYRMRWCGIGRLRWAYLRWRGSKWEDRIRKQLKKDGFSGMFEGRRL